MINLYPHQQQALDETKDKTHVAYYLDMGLGKTFVGSEKMLQLGSNVNLLICQKSKIDDWMEHMVLNYAMNHCWTIYNLTNKEDFDMFFRALHQIDEAEKAGCVVNIVGIINYELAFRRKELLNLEHFTLMLDESSMIQNETAKRSKFVLKLKPDNVILLSGTPTSGKYENLWSQLHLLNWKLQSKDQVLPRLKLLKSLGFLKWRSTKKLIIRLSSRRVRLLRCRICYISKTRSKFFLVHK